MTAPTGTRVTGIATVASRNGQPTEASIGELVAAASKDLSDLVRGEIELAKAELTDAAKTAGIGIGMAAAAGLLAALGMLFALVTLADALDIFLWRWVSWLIVTVLMFVLAGVLGLFGVRALKATKPPARTQTTIKESVEFLKHPRAPKAR